MSKITENLEQVLDRKSTAQLLGICLTTLNRWEDLPKIKIRRRVFYKRSAIMAYLDSMTKSFQREE